MRLSVFSRALVAVFIAVAGTATFARADANDYEFQLIDRTMKTSPDAIVSVRLLNKATGKPIQNAVIFATRLGMAPDGMEQMTAKLGPMAGGEPGIYRFTANVSMAGHWRLSLAAKVQGEPDSLESKLDFEAQK